MKLARLLCAAQALAVFGCAAGTRPPDDARPTRHPLHIRAPDLAQPLFEALPAAGGYPNEVVKEGVFERINRDRLLAGLLPVAWDEAAFRVADAFCAQQIREATRGHFLMDGVPPSPEARRARVLPPRPALRGQDAFAPEAGVRHDRARAASGSPDAGGGHGAHELHLRFLHRGPGVGTGAGGRLGDDMGRMNND